MTKLEEYYNKFNEEKRLLSRHGQVEFQTTMHHIKEALENISRDKERINIADIGAGTGQYTRALGLMGCNVTAFEPVGYNLGILKQKSRDIPNIKAYKRNALKLRDIPDEGFDLTLFMGPMYHLKTKEERIKALNEAKRVTKTNGLIFVSYVMEDYAIIRHGFMDQNIVSAMKDKKVSEDFRIIPSEDDLYYYADLFDIDGYAKECNLTREFMFSPDGLTDYIRPSINEMDEETFELYIDHQIKNSKKTDMLGAGSHTVDVLRKSR